LLANGGEELPRRGVASSKTDTAMRNEVLAKVVCHNVCTVIKSQFELCIQPQSWPENDGPRDLLRMPTRR
jgi:hypothetical protein